MYRIKTHVKKYWLYYIIAFLIGVCLLCIIAFFNTLRITNKLDSSFTVDFENSEKYSAFLQMSVGIILNLLTIVFIYKSFRQQEKYIKRQDEMLLQSNKAILLIPNGELLVTKDYQNTLFYNQNNQPTNNPIINVLNIGNSPCKNIQIFWSWNGVTTGNQHLYLLTYENMPQGLNIRLPIDYLREVILLYFNSETPIEVDGSISDLFHRLDLTIRFDDRLSTSQEVNFIVVLRLIESNVGQVRMRIMVINANP